MRVCYCEESQVGRGLSPLRFQRLPNRHPLRTDRCPLPVHPHPPFQFHHPFYLHLLSSQLPSTNQRTLLTATFSSRVHRVQLTASLRLTSRAAGWGTTAQRSPRAPSVETGDPCVPDTPCHRMLTIPRYRPSNGRVNWKTGAEWILRADFDRRFLSCLDRWPLPASSSISFGQV